MKRISLGIGKGINGKSKKKKIIPAFIGNIFFNK